MDRRMFEERAFKSLMVISTLIILSILAIIIATILIKGLPAMNLDMITKTPKGGYYLGKEGGILNAILGSLYLAGGATILTIFISFALLVQKRPKTFRDRVIKMNPRNRLHRPTITMP